MRENTYNKEQNINYRGFGNVSYLIVFPEVIEMVGPPSDIISDGGFLLCAFQLQF